MPAASPGLFITGTDTDVGKTFITAMIAEELRREGIVVGAYKPACSGSTESADGSVWNDVEVLYRATGGRFDRERISPQRFHVPLAPPVAARREGRLVDREQLHAGAGWFSGRCEMLLVEGVGGLLCPLTESTTVADLAVELQMPVIIVARASLGTINHTLLTVEAARSRRLTIAGVILNDVSGGADDEGVASNSGEIEARSGVAVLGFVAHGTPARLLVPAPERKINWRRLAEGAGHS